MIGKMFGEYKIIEILGKGGMGEVYKALDKNGSEVALKLISNEALQAEGGDIQDIKSRFKRESNLACMLQHINIVRTFAAGEEKGNLYLACEVVSGGDVDKLMKKENMTFEQVIQIMRDVIMGLEEIHKHKLIHRDIKPANILLEETGVAKISDLGMARSTSADRTILTKTGQIMGTPYYMAPEQIRGDELDICCDLYAFGAMFYHCLCGVPPFRPGSGPNGLVEVLEAHLKAPIPEIQNPSIPKTLKQLVYDLLAKEPAQRPSTPTEVLFKLESIMMEDHTDTIITDSPGSEFTLGGSDPAPEEQAENTLSDLQTMVSSIFLSPINSAQNALSSTKIEIANNRLFIYTGTKLQIGRNAIGQDGQDICLRLRPAQGNENKIRQISGKHFKIFVENNKVYICDLGSTVGTEVNSAKISPNVPQKLNGESIVRVAGVISLKVEVITATSMYPFKVKDQETEISSAPAVFISRIDNDPSHSYILIPGKIPLSINDNGQLIPTPKEAIELFNLEGRLGYCDADVCAFIDGEKLVQIGERQARFSTIEPKDQK